MLNKRIQLTFQKAAFRQYDIILSDREIADVVSDFLFRYILAESNLRSLLILYKERDGKKLTKKDKEHISIMACEAKNALRYFDVLFDEELIDRIFGSNDKSYAECSLKKMRDRLVHRVNENVVRALLERHDRIRADLDTYFSLFV